MSIFHNLPIKFAQSRGIALLILMLIVLLLSTSLLLARLNHVDNQLARQEQTALVLARAKAALIGFAATYADDADHKGQPQGYLPCPDFNGDGSSPYSMSSDTSCGEQGKSMIGRLPWRTLGLPPLRDGYGDCLWYAVSGSYKDRPKQVLTSDEDGLLIVKDANGNIIAGTTATDRAIAIVFSSGATLTAQNRGYTGVTTECGADTMTDDANNPLNYLDNLAGIANNATGSGLLNYKIAASSAVFTTTNTTDIPIFVSAPETKDANGQVIFNDVLSIITPRDFEPVYRRMNEWVAERVTQCISNYNLGNLTTFLSRYSVPIGSAVNPAPQSYRANPTVSSLIDSYVQESIRHCKAERCSCNACTTVRVQCVKNCGSDVLCQNNCYTTFNTCQVNFIAETDIAACETKCDQNDVQYKANASAIQMNNSYPWATTAQSVSGSVEESGVKFGRIPTTLLNVTIPDPTDPTKTIKVHAENQNISGEWGKLNGSQCFEDTNDLGDNQWGWWQKWHELVLYTIDNQVTPTMGTYFWIGTKQDASATVPTATNPITCTWDWELEGAFVSRTNTTKKQTIAKIKQPLSTPIAASDWELVDINTLPTFSAADQLTLTPSSINPAEFLTIVAGRKLSTQPNRDNKLDWNSYLEPNNNAAANLFDRKALDATFNDILCKNDATDCKKIPQGNNL